MAACAEVRSLDDDCNDDDILTRHVAKLRTQVEGDSSLMTYTGHTILQTLIRCHFSPAHTTGQSLIYTGCAAGRVVIYDLLTGEIVKVRKNSTSLSVAVHIRIQRNY